MRKVSGIGGYAIRKAAGFAVPMTFLRLSRGVGEDGNRLGVQDIWVAESDPHAMVPLFEKFDAE